MNSTKEIIGKIGGVIDNVSESIYKLSLTDVTPWGSKIAAKSFLLGLLVVFYIISSGGYIYVNFEKGRRLSHP